METFDPNPPTDPNRRFAELAGLCWHEPQFVTLGGITKHKCKKCLKVVRHIGFNPDFAADSREVLKVMREGKDFHKWIAKMNGLSLDEDGTLIDNAIPVGLILDTTGKLRDAAIEWMEEHPIDK